MRFVIFDGIQETHVGDSLERALISRGHLVYNTGKIGHGFRFPDPADDITHLEIAVSKALDFAPDVIFVMRPASLPFPLLKRIRKSGATLIAWFSDDPVLFDLTYGPVVSSYDLVLHCGGARVLEFYEEKFGYPTGVNFPFWTDHQAFPFSWGKEEPTCDLMFLGNVEGSVRRQRYFELGKMGLDIRVHGRTGIDYLGIQGGYLDNDAQVAASAASARIALNIPQFFENHRGIETWFPELQDLGFFEYPSRVIQYMAMGMPTISVIPGRPVFETYPEMMVVEDVVEAESIAKQLIDADELEAISSRTVRRFDANFSAESRVIALEYLLQDDGWKSLDARERACWFAQFTGSETKFEKSEKLALGREVKAQGNSDESLWRLSPILEESDDSLNIMLFGNEIGRFTSRGGAVASTLRELGHNILVEKAGDHMTTLVPDPQKLVKHCINVDKLGRRTNISACDYFIVLGIDAALTQVGGEYFRELGIKTVFFDDQEQRGLKSLTRLAENYDVVVTSNKARYLAAIRRGFENLIFAPKFVSPEFLNVLDSVEHTQPWVHVRRSPEREAETCPALAVETANLDKQQVWTYNSLLKLDEHELASALKSEIGLLSYEGTSAEPVIHDLMPYVAVSCDSLFMARNGNPDRIYPYINLGLSVSDIGELKQKAGWLSSSRELQEAIGEERDRNIGLVSNGLKVVTGILDFASRDNRKSGGVMKTGGKLSVDIVDETNDDSHGNSLLLACDWTPRVGDREEWKLRLTFGGKSVDVPLVECDELRLLGVGSVESVKAEMIYMGPGKAAPMIAAGKPVVVGRIEKVEIHGSMGRKVLIGTSNLSTV